MDSVAPNTDIPVAIREFQPCDAACCHALYIEGLVAGAKLADNDLGLDMDDIASTYNSSAGNGFWVAIGESGEVVGMIGVQQLDEGVGEIRRLRVRVDHQRRGIGAKLIDHALGFCQQRGYLKVTLGTSIGALPAVNLFQKFHFRLDKTKTVAGKEMQYFYLDLYARGRANHHG
jgi:ribosomal protein S18 acetylase RimI-like enzyme